MTIIHAPSPWCTLWSNDLVSDTRQVYCPSRSDIITQQTSDRHMSTDKRLAMKEENYSTFEIVCTIRGDNNELTT